MAVELSIPDTLDLAASSKRSGGDLTLARRAHEVFLSLRRCATSQRPRAAPQTRRQCKGSAQALSRPRRLAQRDRLRVAAAAACLLAAPATAQQAAQPHQPTWQSLPHMQLERQFAGPLQDTIIQRWRDPVDGAVCYIYLPISAQHSLPTDTGYVQYGANTIGSISCFATAAAPLSRKPPASSPRTGAPGPTPSGQ